MNHLLFVCAVIFISCYSLSAKETNIEIIINEDQSYKYDLKNGVYTIYYISKRPSEIKFNLSKEEKNKILDSYYSMKIDKIKEINKITGNIYIEDRCTIMPKSFTKLRIKTSYSLQEIQIDEDCNNFYISNYIRANRIKQYLETIRNILQSKPEIRNAPESEILYM